MFSQFIDKVCQHATVSSGTAKENALFTIKRISHFLSAERNWKGPKTEREFQLTRDIGSFLKLRNIYI